MGNKIVPILVIISLCVFAIIGIYLTGTRDRPAVDLLTGDLRFERYFFDHMISTRPHQTNDLHLLFQECNLVSLPPVWIKGRHETMQYFNARSYTSEMLREYQKKIDRDDFIKILKEIQKHLSTHPGTVHIHVFEGMDQENFYLEIFLEKNLRTPAFRFRANRILPENDSPRPDAA